MPDSLMPGQRWVIAVAVVGTAVLFLSSLQDPVNVVKLTVLVLSALLCVFLVALSVIKSRTVAVPTGWPPLAGLLLLLGFVVAAISAPTAATAVVGTYGRNSGLLAYAAALMLFFVGCRAWTSRSGHVLAFAILLGCLFTASYGLLQYVGVDAIAWSNPFNPIIASLGNPNFAAAYLGMCTPVAVWGALWTGWAVPFRVASAVTGLAALLASALSSAIQGPIAAAAGLAVFAVAWLLGRPAPQKQRGLIATGALAGIGGGTLVAGLAGVGPAAPIFEQYSAKARMYYWQGALEMWRDKPLFGVGLDNYGTFWRQVRPDGATQLLGNDSFSDAAHSVPLQMLAQGGVVLAAAYLFFVASIAVTLILGLRRTEGDARLLLGAFGGVWAAYTVQSLVSIDQVPLLTMQFVAAGAVVGVAGGRAREVRLPGALVPAAATGRNKGRRPTQPRARSLNGLDISLIGLVGLGCCVLAWLSLSPARANAALRQADSAVAAGRGNDALAAYERANELLPGVGIYWERTGAFLTNVDRREQALATYRRGIHHDPYNPALLRSAAAVLTADGPTDEALGYLRRAVDLDPTTSSSVIQYATLEITNGSPAEAQKRLERVLRPLPNDAALWALLGDARKAQSDSGGARTAYERALTLDPANEKVKKALAEAS